MSISQIDPKSILISKPDILNVSTADLFAQITVAGTVVTSSTVATLTTFSEINSIKLNIWTQSTGASSSASSTTSVVVMDPIQITLPCSSVDIQAINAISTGNVQVAITLRKTGNICGQSQPIEDFIFANVTFVGSFFFLQSGVDPSVTLSFKATQLTVNRYSYALPGGTLAGTSVAQMNLAQNTGGN